LNCRAFIFIDEVVIIYEQKSSSYSAVAEERGEYKAYEGKGKIFTCIIHTYSSVIYSSTMDLWAARGLFSGCYGTRIYLDY
jgi:hypothetical protein